MSENTRREFLRLGRFRGRNQRSRFVRPHGWIRKDREWPAANVGLRARFEAPAARRTGD
jgi:hypothetical protein